MQELFPTAQDRPKLYPMVTTASPLHLIGFSLSPDNKYQQANPTVAL